MSKLESIDLSKTYQIYRMDVDLILENEPGTSVRAIMVYNNKELSRAYVDIFKEDGKLFVITLDGFRQEADWNNMAFFLEKDALTLTGIYYNKLVNYINTII